MPRIRTHHAGDLSRDDPRAGPLKSFLVHEIQSEDGSFEGISGPFGQWNRRLEPTATGINQIIDYRSQLPHWGWLVDLASRVALPRLLARNQASTWGPSDLLSHRQASLLCRCATLSLIAGFLGGLISNTLAFLAKDFGETAAAQANALAIIRIGTLVTMIGTALADRLGRRRMLLGSLYLASVAALVTAVAPSMQVVTIAQLVGRGSVAVSAFVIPIICVEEMPKRSRSFAIGVLALPAGLGVGMVLWFLPILDVSQGAWRAMFLVGFALILATRYAGKDLTETRRFVVADHLEPTHHHPKVHPGRFVAIGMTLLLLNVFAAPTQQLQNDYLLEERDFSASRVALFLLLTNTWGFIGVLGGSQIADRWSRKWAAGLGIAGLTLGNTLMFNATGWPMWVASTVGSVVGAMSISSIGALLPELFPTKRRGLANGTLQLLAVAGSVAGLYLVRDRIDTIGYGPTTRLIASFPLLALIPLCFLPETSGQSLEALNDEELPELGSTTVEDEDLGLDEPAIHPIDPTALN